jgi:hypothetical protein
MPHQQIRAAIQQINSEKIRAAKHTVATVIRHKASCHNPCNKGKDVFFKKCLPNAQNRRAGFNPPNGFRHRQ